MDEMYLEFKSGYDGTDKAALVLRQFCKEHSILPELTDRLEICLVEALNNVYEHSYEFNGEGLVELRLLCGEDTLRIEISDWGQARSSFNTPTLDFDPSDTDNLPEGGMGLYLIEIIMDETHYGSSGKKNTFTMIKNL